MKMLSLIVQALPCLFLFCQAVGARAEADAPPWYTPRQVAQGKILFAENCARCHGNNAQATAHWRRSDADGNFPPPPLNGTAHAWHHSLSLLRRTIREGGGQFGGKMPPFKDQLSPAEIDAIIAWFQSLWPDEIYARWSGAGVPRLPLSDVIKSLVPDDKE